MDRDPLTAIVIVRVVAVIALTRSLHPAKAAPQVITAVTTDKDPGHSNDLMTTLISVSSSQTMDGATIRIGDLKDRFAKLHLAREMPATCSPGRVVLTGEHQLPACSSCRGLTEGSMN